MITRRTLLATAPAMLASNQALATDAGDQASFNAYLATVRAEARRAGISAITIDGALSGLHINQRAIDLDGISRRAR